MIWIGLITGLVILGLMFIYAPNYNSKDTVKKRNFHLIWQIGLLVIMLERLVYQLFLR